MATLGHFKLDAYKSGKQGFDHFSGLPAFDFPFKMESLNSVIKFFCKDDDPVVGFSCKSIMSGEVFFQPVIDGTSGMSYIVFV